MTKEILEQAQVLFTEIQEVRAQLKQIDMLVDSVKDNMVKTRVRSMDFELPKAVFRAEVNKRKTELDAQLTTLQAEFDAL